MSESELPRALTLSLTTGDGAGEIVLADGLYREIARGLGNLKRDLPPGLYKVRVEEGLAETSEIIALQDRPVERSYRVQFSSPVPLIDTAEYDPGYVTAVQEQCSQTHYRAGEGSSIFVFARRWPNTDLALSRLPMWNLTLLDADGSPSVDFGAIASRSNSPGLWAACSVSVNPGIYRIIGGEFRGSSTERTIVAPPGYQTQIFLLHRADADREKSDDLADVAVTYSSDRTFDPRSHSARLAELARIGFRCNSRVLSDEIVAGVLAGTFDNAMLGLLGAHLIARDNPPGKTDLSRTVRRLRELLGGAHPDVEALTFYPPGTPTDFIYALPPPMKKSWLLAVEASASNPKIIPAASFAASVAGTITSDEPWIFWRSGPAGTDQKTLTKAFIEALTFIPENVRSAALNAAVVRAQAQRQLSPKAPPAIGAAPVQDQFNYPSFLPKVGAFARQYLNAAVLRAIGKSNKPPSAEQSASVPHKFTEADIQTLVQMLRLPRSNVERIFKISGAESGGKTDVGS